MRLLSREWLFAFAGALAACGAPRDSNDPALDSRASSVASMAPVDVDEALEKCDARWAEIEAAPALAGAVTVDADRVRFLGRARGALEVFVRDPQPTALTTNEQALRDAFEKEPPGIRVARFIARHKRERPLLRAMFLREGYLFADNPDDAFELEAHAKLTDLFDAQKLVLERGEDTFELELKPGKETRYVVSSGPIAGATATILFGDRIREASEAPAPALHRDVVSLSEREGFDRMEVLRRSDAALLVRARYGDTWVRQILASRGPKLAVECSRETADVRARVEAFRADTAWRRRAGAKMREAITALVDDALPFDRPRSETGPDKDGTLRPYWSSAYLRGQRSFKVDDDTYAVYREDGRAWPPSVCVDFVLDAYERASGSWFAPLGEHPGRSKGRLDFSSFGIENRRGVIGFFQFAESRPDLFAFRKFEGAERVPFAQRDRFFAFLTEHGEEVHAGDMLAIQGLKRDGRVHQHAILVETIDPLTGFAAGLADHMKHPRRRTWEGIMAEAPQRSLLFRARPGDVLVRPLDPQSTVDSSAPTTTASTR